MGVEHGIVEHRYKLAQPRTYFDELIPRYGDAPSRLTAASTATTTAVTTLPSAAHPPAASTTWLGRTASAESADDPLANTAGWRDSGRRPPEAWGTPLSTSSWPTTPFVTWHRGSMSSADALSPIDGLLAVLDDGQKSGTNKYMLLLALIDLAPQIDEQDRTLQVRDIAEKVLELAWDQVRPWAAATPVLSQVTSTNREATYVLQALELAQGVGFRSWHQVQPVLASTPEWTNALAKIEHDLNRNPVARLQTLQGTPRQFLYRHDRTEKSVHFADGALEDLVRFGPVLRPLVEHRFTQLVIQANQSVLPAPIDDLVFEHLFGEQRHMPPSSLTSALLDLQRGECLWSGERIRSVEGGAQTDHVLPWARVRLSAAENFVIATPAANRSKTNLLLSERLVARWASHLVTNRTAISDAAHGSSWESDFHRVAGVAAGLYRWVPNGYALWDGTNPPTLLNDTSRDRILQVLEDAQT